MRDTPNYDPRFSLHFTKGINPWEPTRQTETTLSSKLRNETGIGEQPRDQQLQEAKDPHSWRFKGKR